MIFFNAYYFNISLKTLLAITLLYLSQNIMATDSINDIKARPYSQSKTFPHFKVDPFWPKPLPKNWILGQVSGIIAAPNDHIWIIQRPNSLTEDECGAAIKPARSECCFPAPPVMEFDSEGNFIQGWGGPGAGYDWPESEHGLFLDHNKNIWLAGNGPNDHQILKFTQQGKFILQIGKSGKSQGDTDLQNLNGPASLYVDPTANEIYVADGYGNHRVIVFDADTGEYKRHWGANGLNPGNSKVKQFKNPVHSIRVSKDGLVYVADRENNRYQVFKKNGTYLKEVFIHPLTQGNGSVWDLEFSQDAEQKYLFIADGENNRILVTLRETGEILDNFGRAGRQAGQFHWVHNITLDSKGNMYTTEVDNGKRIQKFSVLTN